MSENVIYGVVSLSLAASRWACDRAVRRAGRPSAHQGLVLATPPTAWETRSEQSAIYEQMAALVDSQGVLGLAAMMAQQPPAMMPPVLLEAAPNLGAQMAEQLAAYDAHTLALVLRGAKMTDFPPRDQLRSIEAPALILAWVGDRGHPLSTTTELQSLLPHAETHVAQTLAELRSWPQLMRDFFAR